MADHTPNVLDPYAEPYASREQRAEFADGLRELAEWVETTRFPIPEFALRPILAAGHIEVYSTWIDDDGFVTRAGSAAKIIGGKVEKGEVYAGGDFALIRDFGGGVKFAYRIARAAVCKEVEVEKEVERDVPVDAERAAELEAQMQALKDEADKLERVRVKQTEVVREYACPPSLLAAEAK